MRVLIIEEEIIIARFIEHELKENFQAETQIALNVGEAFTAIKHFIPHLVLCDIEFKRYDGWH